MTMRRLVRGCERLARAYLPTLVPTNIWLAVVDAHCSLTPAEAAATAAGHRCQRMNVLRGDRTSAKLRSGL
jgi:hypothetical protein